MTSSVTSTDGEQSALPAKETYESNLKHTKRQFIGQTGSITQTG